MPRAHRSVAKRKRHHKWIKRAKGYRGRRNSVFKIAKEAVLKAGQHAYNDRRKKKASFRQEWQAVINAAAKSHKISYSRLIGGLRKNNVEIDRKVLSQIAIDQPELFEQIVQESQKTK